MYNCIPADNFILFLRKAEFRYKLNQYDNNDAKEKKSIEILEYLYNTVNYKFYDMGELIDNNNYEI